MKQRTKTTDKNISVFARVMLTVAALFTAIAVAVTCGLCMDFSQPVVSDNVTAGQATTSTTYSNKTALSGQIINGDIIEYSAGSHYTVSLGPGQYKFEAYGAQGASSTAGGTGGLGGYTYGTYTTTTAKTIYIYVGSTGGAGDSTSTSTHAGGYNGGGSTTYNAGAGGGATHFATADGLLSGLSGNTGAVMLVAGGGGGAQNRNGGGGGGGTRNGVQCPSTSYGSGGCGGGTGGPHGDPNSSHNTTTNAGSFGQGGAGAKGGDGNCGGGGGGGYYGGCGTTTDGSVVDDKGGGGGSGYINTSHITGGDGTSATRSGNGLARITAISVNQNPTTRNASFTVNARGIASSVAVAATTIASDPDSGQTVYFTDGNSSNYDTLNTAANSGLYVNSACSVSANKYFTWTWQSTSQLTITGVVLFPRAGVDGAAASGNNVVITLYTKIRDNYNSNTSRGCSTINFNVTVPPASMSLKTGTHIAETVIGTSNTTTAPDNPATATNIYNPTSGRNTLFIKKALVIGTPFTTIRATDLINMPGGLSTANHTPVISINSTTAITGSARKYKINEVDAGSTVTAYNSSKATIANAYSQLTIQCLTPDVNYQVLPLTLYLVENTTAYGTATPNAVPNVATIALDIVFKMENTRPILKNGVNNIVDVNVNQTLNLSLNDYFYDADAASAITTSTHSILGVTVPANEFILLSKQKAVLTPNAPNASYYNKGSVVGTTTFDTTAQGDTATGFNSDIIYNATAGGTDISREAFMRVSYSGITLTVTGIRSSFSQYTSTRANPAGHFYLLLHIRDNRDTADNGIWLPIAFRVGYNTNYTPVATVTDPTSATTGQNKLTAYPYADGAVGDSFYFAPMAVTYSGTHVIGQYLNDSGTLTSTGLQPLALDGDNFTTTNGLKSRTAKLNEFLTLSSATTAQAIVDSVSTKGSTYNSTTGIAENQFIKAQLIDIYVPKSYFTTAAYNGGRIVVGSGTATDNGYKYISLASSTNTTYSDYYVTKGIKITLKSATMNRYMYASVGVTDVTGKTVTGIDIAIRVKNTAPNAWATTDNKVATFDARATGNDAFSTYANTGSPTITYRMPLGSSVIVTPYDFGYDYDMTTSGVSYINNGFTLNGFNGKYSGGLFTLGAGNDVSGSTFNGLFDASVYGSATYQSSIAAMLSSIRNNTATAVKISNGTTGTAFGTATSANQAVNSDKLFFARSSDPNASDARTYDPTAADFSVNMSNTSGFVTTSFGNNIKIGNDTYPLDYVVISAGTRTTQPATITLTVRDRYGDSTDGTGCFTVRIVIEVINTKPAIKSPSFYQELAVSPIMSGEEIVRPSTVVFTANGNNGDGLMSDADNDNPEFLTSRGVIIANTRVIAGMFELETFDSIISDHPEYLTIDGTATGQPLTDYVSASVVSRTNLSVTALSPTKAIPSGVFVYFFVTDNTGGLAIGYVQIEVLNTAPELNTSPADGFELSDPLWNIETTSGADIGRFRYIAGSQSVKTLLKSTRSGNDADVKVIATDIDGLHDKTVLQQRYMTGVTESSAGTLNYAALPTSGSAFTADELNAAVPSVINATRFGGSAASVILFTVNADNSLTAGAPASSGYSAILLFYVNDEWKTRDSVISELTGKTLSDAATSNYFDEQGRWTVTEWALQLAATEGFGANIRIGLTLSVRDEAYLGGDTSGQKTAYNSNRGSTVDGGKVAVNGLLTATVYQHISRTGILSINEFLGKNGDYYTVEYTNAANQTVNYVSTYDGNTSSTYPSALSDIRYTTVNNNSQLSSDSSATLIKSRGAGSPDGTLAGVNSGKPYSAATSDDLVGAFKYSDTIVIPSARDNNGRYVPVYVPMSYFGMLQTIATPVMGGGSELNSVNYSSDYVGYDVGSNSANVALDNLANFESAITISDGTTSWGGENKASYPISKNPYISVEAFSYLTNGSINSNSNSLELFTGAYAEYSTPYYNNRLATLTVDVAGSLLGFEQNSVNHANFVGDGRLMYLADQATKLKEHNFGLRFAKKDMRTGVRDLTITIKLAKQNISGDTSDNELKNQCTVELKIRIENSQFDLFDDGTTVKYDETKGTYYTEVTMSSSESRSFALVRRNAGGVNESFGMEGFDNLINLAYTDDDYYVGPDYEASDYRDYAYFSSDSFVRMGNWQAGEQSYKHATQVENNQLVNTKKTTKAQSSMLYYFGADSFSAVEDVAIDYIPNDGCYGTAREGYSGYFNASLLEGGRVLNITALRKTYINDFVLTEQNVGATQADVTDFYAERGLVAVYDNAGVPAYEPSRVYYPFGTLVYDSCGAGWTQSSVTAIEIRVTIVNGSPSLKAVGKQTVIDNVQGREFDINLAVGNTVNINLYDIVSDPDIFTSGYGGIYTLATQNYFRQASSGIARETGDYLDSPLDHDRYAAGGYDALNVNSDADGFYRNGGGFSAGGSTDRDVIMWMETENGIPSSNNIFFTVNRRTTKEHDGEYISINRYKFILRFYDGVGEVTAPFCFVINVTNQTPTVTDAARSFTMCAGDDLTIVTTYYDVFTGVTGGKSSAFANSRSNTLLTARENSAGYGVSHGDGANSSTSTGYWVYRDITTANCANSMIYNSTTDRGGNSRHLGYYALADDDTPWRLRISNVSYDQTSSKLYVSGSGMMTLGAEGGSGENRMAYYIRAQAACVNEPVTFTLTDGEGGTVSITLYFTIISSPPIALDYGNSDQRVFIENAGLEGVPENTGSGYASGLYRLYTVPSDTPQDFDINGMSERKRAQKTYKISMRNVAIDPDGDNETSNMALYRDGCFTVNDVPLMRGSDGNYASDYFYISVAADGRSFDLVATGYNPDTSRGYEVVTFRIADYGNGSADNTLTITLRVYTLYSDLQNETVSTMSANDYESYLGGRNKVTVKSFDQYYTASEAAAPSAYAVVKLTGNNGNDGNNGTGGNTQYPVIDRDFKNVGDVSYSVRLYAFFDVDDGVAEKLPAADLNDMFVRNATTKTFALDRSNGADYNAYLIGGMLYNGNEISATFDASSRLSIVNKYVDFEFTAGGAAVLFTPVASTLGDKNILLYVEVQKYIASSRMYQRDDAVMYSGSLFTLEVTDSAPCATGATYSVEGKKGDVITVANIHNPTDPFNALFVDSDKGDRVTVSAFDDAAYTAAMRTAMEEKPDLDWQAGDGKPRAFDISVSPDNMLVITVNRRIDYIVGGRYMPSVTFPIVITGYDRQGAQTTATVYLTVSNTDITAVEQKTVMNEATGIGYTFSRNAYDGIYNMSVNLRYRDSIDIMLADILNDADYTSEQVDTDSYKFLAMDNVYPYDCLYDSQVNLKWFPTKPDGSIDEDNFVEIATVDALGDDVTHRTGFRINAFASVRNLTATMYLCVIDRAADETLQNAGLVIKVDIIVMNDAPHTLEGKETTTIYMMGSNNNEPKGMLFFIGDFVRDNNTSDVVGDDASANNLATYLRIFRQEARVATSIFSPIYTSAKGESAGSSESEIDSSALFTVTIPQRLDDSLIRDYIARDGSSVTSKDNTNTYNQWFVITPVRGFYGEGSVDITVADGESHNDVDTLTTTFHITVHVIYDQAEAADTLNAIEIASCKTRTVDVQTLLPEVTNLLVTGDGVTTSSDVDTFSHSRYYELTAIEFLNSTESRYATFERVGTTSVWTLTAGKEITMEPVRVNVTITLINDRTKKYNKHFWLNIIANQAPKSRYSELTFTRYGDEPDALRDLNESGTIKLQAWQLFSDVDDPTGNEIKMLDVKSQVESIVKVSFEKDENGNNRFLVINFTACGESEITVTVTDETGNPVELKFLARNEDLPQPSLWVRIIASFEANMVMWAIIVGCVILALIIFIIIIALIRKRKREREELEALLVSEMEIEEQMLRLAGGPTPTDYQSYGYLPPTGGMPETNQLMLDSGATEPAPDLTALPPGNDVPPSDGTM